MEGGGRLETAAIVTRGMGGRLETATTVTREMGGRLETAVIVTRGRRWKVGDCGHSDSWKEVEGWRPRP